MWQDAEPLCSSDDVTQLKQMRQSGCTRLERMRCCRSRSEVETVALAEETAKGKAASTKTEEQKREKKASDDEE